MVDTEDFQRWAELPPIEGRVTLCAMIRAACNPVVLRE